MNTTFNGYFVDRGFLIPCDSSCMTCALNAKRCISCPLGKVLTLDFEC